MSAQIGGMEQASRCLLYTSDAADERSSVDLGGRRIIKKKKRITITATELTSNKHRQDSNRRDSSRQDITEKNEAAA